MLADDLLADKVLLKEYDGMDKMYARIRAAQKFTLSREFTVAADGLVENLTELCKILPYCRLPFPRTWIEWVHDERPHWDQDGPYKARQIDVKRHQMAPQRCALLLEQIGDFAGCWKAHLFWSLKELPAPDSTKFNGSLGAIIMDTSKIMELAESPDFNTEASLELALDCRCQADFGQKLLARLEVTHPDISRRLAEYAVEDWGGEIRFMVAVLGLLNTRNVAQFHAVDKTEHNRKRAKQKKQPLFSHTVLKIRPELWLGRSGGSNGPGDHRILRSHFVRGHFKHRKTGLFYWNHYVRGNKKYGKIEKDYEVT